MGSISKAVSHTLAPAAAITLSRRQRSFRWFPAVAQRLEKELVLVAVEYDAVMPLEDLFGLLAESRDREVGKALPRDRGSLHHPRLDLRVQTEVHSALVTCLHVLGISSRHLINTSVWQIATSLALCQ